MKILQLIILITFVLLFGFIFYTIVSESTDDRKNDVISIEFDQTGTESTQFKMEDILPGDSETKNFDIKVNHQKETRLKLRFMSHSKNTGNNIQEVLKLKIKNNNEVIFDGPFTEFQNKSYLITLQPNEEKETILHYEIEVYLPTSVTSDYQNSSFSGEFVWSAETINQKSAVPVIGMSILSLYTGTYFIYLIVKKKRWLFK